MNRFLFTSLLLPSLFSPQSLEVTASSLSPLSPSTSGSEFDCCGALCFRIRECGLRSDPQRQKSRREEANLIYFRWPRQVPQAFTALMVYLFGPIWKSFLLYHISTQSLIFFLWIWWSNLDHPGVAKLVAAHAKPPNYMFFFEFYEAGSLAEKLHVEEWSPSVDQVLTITLQLGIWLISLWWWILNRYIYEPKSVSFMFQLRHCSISTRMGLFIGMWNQLMFL